MIYSLLALVPLAVQSAPDGAGVIDTLEVSGKLLSKRDDVPLEGWGVHLLPSGVKYGHSTADQAHSGRADRGGRFTVEGLEGEGPWSAWITPPLATGQVRFHQPAWDAGEVQAGGDADGRELRVRTGSDAVLTSPLPAGVAAGELFFRMYYPQRGESSSMGSGVTGVGRAGPKGNTLARMPLCQSGLPSGVVYSIMTVDGRWSLHTWAERNPKGRFEFKCEAPLRQRAVAQFDLVLSNAYGEASVEDALRAIDWRRLDQKRARLGVGEFEGCIGSPLLALGHGRFQIGDLPLGTVELTTHEFTTGARAVVGWPLMCAEHRWALEAPVLLESAYGTPKAKTARIRREYP